MFRPSVPSDLSGPCPQRFANAALDRFQVPVSLSDAPAGGEAAQAPLSYVRRHRKGRRRHWPRSRENETGLPASVRAVSGGRHRAGAYYASLVSGLLRRWINAGLMYPFVNVTEPPPDWRAAPFKENDEPRAEAYAARERAGESHPGRGRAGHTILRYGVMIRPAFASYGAKENNNEPRSTLPVLWPQGM